MLIFHLLPEDTPEDANALTADEVSKLRSLCGEAIPPDAKSLQTTWRWESRDRNQLIWFSRTQMMERSLRSYLCPICAQHCVLEIALLLLAEEE